MHRPSAVERLTRLRQLPAGVVGGLVVELGEAARTRVRRERWESEVQLWDALREALDQAADGREPTTRVTRLPLWAAAALRHRLRDHDLWWLSDTFVVARTLEVLGLVELEVDDDYVLSMLTGLVACSDWDAQIWGDPVAWFLEDPDLVARAYWRAYTIEGQGVVSLRVNDGDRMGTDWRTATRQLIEEGRVARRAVVAACVDALDRDFSPAASGWFVAMLGDLDLAVAELADLQPALRRQLGHRAPKVVTNALAWLSRLDATDRLDDEATAAALMPVLLAPTKAAALAGVRLLRAIAARTPSADVVSPARAGLSHRHADVQRAAARLLLAVGARDALLADAEQLGAGVRAELGLEVDTAPVVAAPAVVGDAAPSWTPASHRDVAERLAALLERADDPFELELVLDALAGLGTTDLLRPLVKRARTVLAANEMHRLEQQLAALVLTSTGTPAHPSGPAAPWARFLHRRLAEVGRILDGTEPPRRRLATPTEPSGRLDRVAFVERFERLDAAQRDPELLGADLVAAMLRLGPGQDQDVLPRWDGLVPTGSPVADVVRHALGAEPGAARPQNHPALWVAASRARTPLGDDPVLVEHALGGAGQGRALRGTVSVTANPRWNPDTWDQYQWDLSVTYEHACTPASFSASQRASWWTRNRPRDVDQPTATADLGRRASIGADSEWIDPAWLIWHGLTWPADAEHFARAVVEPTFDSRQWTTHHSTVPDVLAALRRHPGRIGPTANVVLALAVTGGTLETRVHASDTVVDLVGRRRTTADALAKALAVTAPAAVLTRWHETFERVATAEHPEIVLDVLGLVLPTLPRAQRGLHALVDLLHQELLRSGRRVTEPSLRAYMEGFSGSSKAAGTARALLAL